MKEKEGFFKGKIGTVILIALLLVTVGLLLASPFFLQGWNDEGIIIPVLLCFAILFFALVFFGFDARGKFIIFFSIFELALCACIVLYFNLDGFPTWIIAVAIVAGVIAAWISGRIIMKKEKKAKEEKNKKKKLSDSEKIRVGKIEEINSRKAAMKKIGKFSEKFDWEDDDNEDTFEEGDE